MAANIETLWCREGEHYWTRQRVTGTKPRSCATHTTTRQRRFAREPRNRAGGLDSATRPFGPLYGHLADAVLALHTDGDVATHLRHLAEAAELIARNRAWTHRRPPAG